VYEGAKEDPRKSWFNVLGWWLLVD
jgi:hypothetical protein